MSDPTTIVIALLAAVTLIGILGTQAMKRDELIVLALCALVSFCAGYMIVAAWLANT